MKDYKYSLEIMKQELESKYICLEIKYAFNASIEALEKQLPEVPILQNDKINHWYECRKCNHIISKIMDIYCPHCGQKIKWI